MPYSVTLNRNLELHPYDLYGILERETVFRGVLVGPERRRKVPEEIIDLFRGNKRTIRVFVTDPCLNAINLTDAVALFTMRDVPGGTIYVQKTTADPTQGIIAAANKGEVYFYILGPDTESLDIRQYVWDVTVFLPNDDEPYTVLWGVLNLKEPVGLPYPPPTPTPSPSGAASPSTSPSPASSSSPSPSTSPSPSGSPSPSPSSSP